ncbi:MAG: hypothetical protein AAB368_06460, partial [bacterium]
EGALSGPGPDAERSSPSVVALAVGAREGVALEPTLAHAQQVAPLDGRGAPTNVAEQRTVYGVRWGEELAEVVAPGIAPLDTDQMTMGVFVRHLARDAASGLIVGYHETVIPPRRLEYIRYETYLAQPIERLFPPPGAARAATPPAGQPIPQPPVGPQAQPAMTAPDLQSLTAALAGGRVG